jgi:hypothetical protein
MMMREQTRFENSPETPLTAMRFVRLAASLKRRRGSDKLIANSNVLSFSSTSHFSHRSRLREMSHLPLNQRRFPGVGRTNTP